MMTTTGPQRPCSNAADGWAPPAWQGAPAAAAAMLLVLLAQLLVGTRGGEESTLRLDRPYHQDYWYYAGLARALRTGLPPRNPACAGVFLSQYCLHLAPLSLLSLVLSPYLAMRLLNVLYAGLLLLLLRRYFPRPYGILGCCLLFTGPPVYDANPLSMDLLSRGFHHLPFFMLLLAALFERRRRALRHLCLFALPWAHGLLTLGFGPLLLYVCLRERWRLVLSLLAGLALAGAGVMLASGGHGGNPLLRAVGWHPLEPLLHLVPLAPLLLVVRQPLLAVAAGSAWVVGSVVGWNRYYFVFPLDFALGLAAGLGLAGRSRAGRWTSALCALLAFAFFVHGMVRQFGPHRPYSRAPVSGALDWVQRHTPPDAVFLQAPTAPWLLEDETYYRRFGCGYWLLEQRDLYIAYFGWADDLGLPGSARSAEVHAYFRAHGPRPPGVQFIFHGPTEQLAYPRWQPEEDLSVVYEDGSVTIFQVR